MIKPLAVALVLVMAAATSCAGEADPVAKWLNELASDEFAKRQAAEKELTAYIATRPAEVMEIGHRLERYRQKAEPEIQRRLANVLNAFAQFGRPATDNESISPSYSGELGASIRGLPVFVIIVTSVPMLQFYRAHIQKTFLHLKMPDLDFGNWLLAGAYVTSLTPEMLVDGARGLACMKSPSCRRDFERKETLFHSVVGLEDGEYFKWPRSSVLGMKYRLGVHDLPLIMTFSPVREELKGSEVTLRYQVADAHWRDAEKILKEANLFAFRKLAETCDATIAAQTRRDFLQKAYMLDPLLPYVMFTNLAEKHPGLFKQDYEYWKDKAPDAEKSIVVGKLFRAALEEGKKIVENKQKEKRD